MHGFHGHFGGGSLLLVVVLVVALVLTLSDRRPL
jgi:hypothetical protein